jgi:hypothetical protein
VVQAFETAALTLPVSDRIVDEGELAQAPEIRNRKDRFENTLKTDIIALIRKQFHLKEPFVRFLLNLNKVRNWDRCFDFRKVDSLAGGAVGLTLHFYPLLVTRTESELHALPVLFARKIARNEANTGLADPVRLENIIRCLTGCAGGSNWN